MNLVERLRKFAEADYTWAASMCEEAANEIELLQAQRDGMNKYINAVDAKLSAMEDERDALKELLTKRFGSGWEDWDAARYRVQEKTIRTLTAALNAMLTHMGMDEDEWNKPTFDQARAALRKQ